MLNVTQAQKLKTLSPGTIGMQWNLGDETGSPYVFPGVLSKRLMRSLPLSPPFYLLAMKHAFCFTMAPHPTDAIQHAHQRRKAMGLLAPRLKPLKFETK